MKSILVLAGGSDTDEPVFETALLAARLFSAHLEFVHIHIGAGQAAVHMPHVAFASGPALQDALEHLQVTADTRLAAAERHVRDFCARSMIPLVDVPNGAQGVTAAWCQAESNASRHLIFHSRHSDLIVAGRLTRPNGLPFDILDTLVMNCGRPMLLACSPVPCKLTGTVMVCWKETPDAARALVAATPFLARAERVVFTAVEEGDRDIRMAVDDVASRFRWRGIPVDVDIVAANGRAIPDLLSSAARNCDADLVVMGAYGHSRIRELLAGGCTRSVLKSGERPVLLFH